MIKLVRVQLLIIIVFAVIAYLPIFGNEFVIDDITFIKDWQEIRQFNLAAYFQGAVPAGHEGVYRPLRSVLYAIYYQIFGQNPWGWHAHSLAVHVVCTVVVYLIIRRISQIRRIGLIWPFVAALLFGLHPIHTETITYISASMESTGTVCFFLSFYLYVLARQAKKLQSIYYWSSAIAALVAFFTYEFTATLPLLLLLYEFCFGNGKKHQWGKYTKTILPYGAGAAAYFGIRFFVLHITSRGPYLADSIYLTFLTMTKVFVHYLGLVIFPLHQVNNHIISPGIEAFVYRDYRTEAIRAQTLGDPGIVFSLVILVGLLVLAIKLYKKYPVVSFAIGWFFISLLPVSEIVPQGSMMNEKFLYIPSFGFCLLVGWVLTQVQNSKFKVQNDNSKFKINKTFNFKLKLCTLHFALLTLIVSYLLLTTTRNLDWHDEVRLWSKDIQTYPNDNAYAYFALGNAYTRQEDYAKANQAYDRSWAINPHFVVALGSIARNYALLGDDEKAAVTYQKAIAVNPNFWEARFNLGNLYLKHNELDKAKNQYTEILKIYPSFQPAQNNLNIILRLQQPTIP